MFQSIINIITTGITWGFQVFKNILTSTGMIGPFLGVFACVVITRFIIMPLLGGKGIGKRKGDSSDE